MVIACKLGARRSLVDDQAFQVKGGIIWGIGCLEGHPKCLVHNTSASMHTLAYMCLCHPLSISMKLSQGWHRMFDSGFHVKSREIAWK